MHTCYICFFKSLDVSQRFCTLIYHVLLIFYVKKATLNTEDKVYYKVILRPLLLVYLIFHLN